MKIPNGTSTQMGAMLQQKCYVLLNSPDFLDLMYPSGQELTESVQPITQSDEPEPKTSS